MLLDNYAFTFKNTDLDNSHWVDLYETVQLSKYLFKTYN